MSHTDRACETSHHHIQHEGACYFCSCPPHIIECVYSMMWQHLVSVGEGGKYRRALLHADVYILSCHRHVRCGLR